MTQSSSTHETLIHIPIDRVHGNPNQPRLQFSRESLEELAESIKAIGIIHPPTVRACGDGSFELIAGERRLRAAKLAGLKTIPAIVHHTSTSRSAQAALIENIQRIDLNPMEIAKALKNLMMDGDLDQEEVAKKVGKKRSTVANYLRLLHLPLAIQTLIFEEKLSMGHAKVVMSCQDERKQIALAQRIVDEKWTVRQAEAFLSHVPQHDKQSKRPEKEIDIHLQALSYQLEKKFGTHACIEGDAKSGSLKLHYYSLSDLDRLLELLGINCD